MLVFTSIKKVKVITWTIMNKRKYYVLSLISLELLGQQKIKNSFWCSYSFQSCEVPKVKGSTLLTGVVKSWLHVYLVISVPGTTTGGSSAACPELFSLEG